MKRITGAALATLITGALLSIASPAQADRPMSGANQPTCAEDGRTEIRPVVLPQSRPGSTSRVKIKLVRSIDGGKTKTRYRVRDLTGPRAIRVRLRDGEHVRIDVVKGGRVSGSGSYRARGGC